MLKNNIKKISVLFAVFMVVLAGCSSKKAGGNIENSIANNETTAEQSASLQETTAQETQESTTVPETESETQEITEAQTPKPTQAPTQKPTQTPTQKSTQAPKPTQKPETGGEESNGGSGAGDIKSQVESNTSSYMSIYREVLTLVNEIRADAGVELLELDTTLCKAAGMRSLEMENASVFSHTRPNGTSCFTIFDEYGITYMTAGENIAAGQRDAQEVVTAWKNSPGHYQNMVNPDFKKLGVGLSKQNIDKYGIYWTQLFTG